MSSTKSPVQILQALDKSNCGQCGEKTCLAFAGAVFKGRKKIEECPKVHQKTIEEFSVEQEKPKTAELDGERYLKRLSREVIKVDFIEAAERTGGVFSNGRLTLKVLGRNFSVDTEGNLFSDIHINPWVAVPFLNYILHGRGLPLTGIWTSFRELKGGKEQYPLFRKRCEESMKKVADTYADLFDDMIHIFSGEPVEKQFESDISVVLYPLPKVPIMICYWLPEDGLASSLNVYFDSTADDNLGADSIFTLGGGLSQMFVKIAMKHGFK